MPCWHIHLKIIYLQHSTPNIDSLLPVKYVCTVCCYSVDLSIRYIVTKQIAG